MSRSSPRVVQNMTEEDHHQRMNKMHYMGIYVYMYMYEKQRIREPLSRSFKKKNSFFLYSSSSYRNILSPSHLYFPPSANYLVIECEEAESHRLNYHSEAPSARSVPWLIVYRPATVERTPRGANGEAVPQSTYFECRNEQREVTCT